MSQLDGPRIVTPQVERPQLRRSMLRSLTGTAIACGIIGIFAATIGLMSTPATPPEKAWAKPPIDWPRVFDVPMQPMDTSCASAGGNDYQGAAVLDGDGPCTVSFRYEFAHAPSCAAAVRRPAPRGHAAVAIDAKGDGLEAVELAVYVTPHAITFYGGHRDEVAYWTCVGTP